MSTRVASVSVITGGDRRQPVAARRRADVAKQHAHVRPHAVIRIVERCEQLVYLLGMPPNPIATRFTNPIN